MNIKGKAQSFALDQAMDSTDLESPENVRDLSAKCKTPAEHWAPVADDLWECSGHCAGCEVKQKSSAL